MRACVRVRVHAYVRMCAGVEHHQHRVKCPVKCSVKIVRYSVKLITLKAIHHSNQFKHVCIRKAGAGPLQDVSRYG